MEMTGLPSGTVYPALRRLERDALVESRWKPQAEASAKQRSARRYYEATAAGKTVVQPAPERFPLLSRLLVEKPS